MYFKLTIYSRENANLIFLGTATVDAGKVSQDTIAEDIDSSKLSAAVHFAQTKASSLTPGFFSNDDFLCLVGNLY